MGYAKTGRKVIVGQYLLLFWNYYEVNGSDKSTIYSLSWKKRNSTVTNSTNINIFSNISV